MGLLQNYCRRISTEATAESEPNYKSLTIAFGAAWGIIFPKLTFPRESLPSDQGRSYFYKDILSLFSRALQSLSQSINTSSCNLLFQDNPEFKKLLKPAINIPSS